SPQQVANRTKACRFPAAAKKISVRHFQYLRGGLGGRSARNAPAVRDLSPSADGFDASMIAEPTVRPRCDLQGSREALGAIPQSATIAPV
ncbi:MAG TPA: hypothetical protein VER98_11380, partial [Terriglobia bacterium]|nr:hypothetical protein [Terriglobia bacterium]